MPRFCLRFFTMIWCHSKWQGSQGRFAVFPNRCDFSHKMAHQGVNGAFQIHSSGEQKSIKECTACWTLRPWASTAEDHVGFYICQPGTESRGFLGHKFTINRLLDFDFCCGTWRIGQLLYIIEHPGNLVEQLICNVVCWAPGRLYLAFLFLINCAVSVYS